MKKVTIKYKWNTDSDTTGAWLKLYLISEDENWFNSREDAIKWLEKNKHRISDFGESECFMLEEMFFI